MHVGIVSWRSYGFADWLSAIRPSLGNEQLIVCCKEGELESYSEALAKSNAIAFSPEKMHGILGWEKSGNMHTIGHCRNLILLTSQILAGHENLVFFDDDVFPSGQSIRSFRSSFEKYDLVQGNYLGDDANGIRQMVAFFGLLENAYAGRTNDFSGALLCLRGKCGSMPELQPQELKGSAGGVLGISSRLKARMHFAPTTYRCEDHFYEFYSRFKLKEMKFMDPGVSPEDIPLALHSRECGNLDSLVSAYLLELRSQIAEKYLYFKLAGALPAIMNGKHALVRSNHFDPTAIAEQSAQESALQKMQTAARFYLSKNPPEEVAQQLQRFANIKLEDFALGLAELERIYSDFKVEGEKLEEAARSRQKKSMENELRKLLVQV